MLSGTSINTYARAIKTFYSWITEQGLISANPLAPVKIPKKPKTLPKVYTEPELRALLAAAEANIRDKAIVSLFIDSGIRLGELAGIKMGNLDIDAGWVKVMGKGRKERIVPFQSDAAQCLELYVAAKRQNAGKDDFLFLTEDGLPLSKRGVQSLLVRLGKKAGVQERLSPHKLRHSFATLGSNYGANLEQLRIILGHSDIKTTSDSYLNLRDGDVKRAHARFSPLENLKHSGVGRQTGDTNKNQSGECAVSPQAEKEQPPLKGSISVPVKVQAVDGQNGQISGMTHVEKVIIPITNDTKMLVCVNSPDNFDIPALRKWKIPTKKVPEIIRGWRSYHKQGKHEICKLYARLHEDLTVQNIPFDKAEAMLLDDIWASENSVAGISQVHDIARLYRPWENSKQLDAFNREKQEPDEFVVEYRQKHLKGIENLLKKLREDVNGSLSANEYGSVFKIETDPFFQSLLWHCGKIDIAFGRLKLNCGRLQRLNEEKMRSDNDQISINPEKKQQQTLQKETVKSAKELQKKIEETLKTKSYLTQWCSACIPDRKKRKRSQ